MATPTTRDGNGSGLKPTLEAVLFTTLLESKLLKKVRQFRPCGILGSLTGLVVFSQVDSNNLQLLSRLSKEDIESLTLSQA